MFLEKVAIIPLTEKSLKNYPNGRGAWLAQLLEHSILDLGVVVSSPPLSVEIT